MTTPTYNGWTNYETWAWKLWMDNDQRTQKYWADQARDCIKNPESNPYMLQDRQIVHTLARRLQEDCEAQAEQLVSTSGPFADLLGSAIGQINWVEIAEDLIKEVGEEGVLVSTQTLLVDTIKGYIDREGLTAILTALQDMCYAKAEHAKSAWQDEGLAKAWEQVGRGLNKPLRTAMDSPL